MLIKNTELNLFGFKSSASLYLLSRCLARIVNAWILWRDTSKNIYYKTHNTVLVLSTKYLNKDKHLETKISSILQHQPDEWMNE